MEKTFFTIVEVSELLGVSVPTLRFWEKEFDIINPSKSPGGKKLYTKKDIEDVELVYFLVKEQGFTIKAAKEKIKANKNKAISKKDIVEKLKSIRAEILEFRESLDNLDSDKITF